MDSSPQSSPALPPEFLKYVETRFGQHSLVHFQNREARNTTNELILSGVAIEDVAARLLHRESLRDPLVANEFLGHFLNSMMKIGHFSMGDGLRRFLDSGDLVNSVAGSVWLDLKRVECNTRKEFLAFLGKRLRWKAADKVKGLHAKMRRADLQRDLDIEAAALSPAAQDGPSTIAGNKEDLERVAVAMVRLPDRDQEILRRHFRGESAPQIAQALNIKHDAARKAIQRAIKKVRAYV